MKIEKKILRLLKKASENSTISVAASEIGKELNEEVYKVISNLKSLTTKELIKNTSRSAGHEETESYEITSKGIDSLKIPWKPIGLIIGIISGVLAILKFIYGLF